jgi:hypothetical protein
MRGWHTRASAPDHEGASTSQRADMLGSGEIDAALRAIVSARRCAREELFAELAML